jgi:hypothetical protein
LSSLRVDPPTHFMTLLLCYYINASRSIQQIRYVSDESLDRIVFPGEKIMFESLPESLLEIYTYTTTGLQLFQTIACSQLQVKARSRAELEK